MSTNKSPHLQLDYLGPGDSYTDNGFAFGTSNIDRLDLYAWLGAVGHHHDGQTFDSTAPAVGPDLSLDDTQGVLSAGTTFYYVMTLVDVNDFETLASPETFITTPSPISAPLAPTPTVQTTGGALLPGIYSYALSAYKDANTLETRADNLISVQVLVGTTTNQITLFLPALPTGATGFNVYRRAPGESAFHFLDAIDMDVATPPTSYVDDGTAVEDCDRDIPTINTTNSQNAIVVSFPTATPDVPEGYTWKIYRTVVSGLYVNALLHHVVEETAEGSGIVIPYYTDLGYSTTAGQPPNSAISVRSPEKIQLDDAAEVQGTLPPASLAYLDIVEFSFPGVLEVAEGTFVWRCLYDEYFIEYVTLNLGDTFLASGAEDVIDVLWFDTHAATPSWISIFDHATPAHPYIAVGEQFGDEFTPTHSKVLKGDLLRCDVLQVGDAATPTDADLLIQVFGYGKMNTTTSIVFP